uniref:Uncharacterized protein n=1 Tax=Glossina austeni TaxID=7395 RepID=A0A1A9VX52_GLOAU
MYMKNLPRSTALSFSQSAEEINPVRLNVTISGVRFVASDTLRHSKVIATAQQLKFPIVRITLNYQFEGHKEYMVARHALLRLEQQSHSVSVHWLASSISTCVK